MFFSKYVSCAKERIGWEALRYIRRELSRTIRLGATLHKYALSRSAAYAYAIKSAGNAQVKAVRDTFAQSKLHARVRIMKCVRIHRRKFIVNLGARVSSNLATRSLPRRSSLMQFADISNENLVIPQRH